MRLRTRAEAASLAGITPGQLRALERFSVTMPEPGGMYTDEEIEIARVSVELLAAGNRLRDVARAVAAARESLLLANDND